MADEENIKMDDETPKQRNFPEDVLNLELKYLDENIRPYITECAEAWRGYMNGDILAHKVLTTIQVLLLQVRPVQRFTEHELDIYEVRLWGLWNANGDQKNEMGMLMLALIRDVNDKIGACKMFARPSDDDVSGGFAALLSEVKKNE